MSTTVQLDNETWAMLDRLKVEGETFDDVVRKLVSVAPDHVEHIAKARRGIHIKTELQQADLVEELPVVREKGKLEEGCVHHDPVTREGCGEEPLVRTFYEAVDADDLEVVWFFCEEHVPEDARKVLDL